MSAKEKYQRATGDNEPSNQIAYHEWYQRYVRWLEKEVETQNKDENIPTKKDDYSFSRVSVEERQRERSNKYDYLIGDNDDDIKLNQNKKDE